MSKTVKIVLWVIILIIVVVVVWLVMAGNSTNNAVPAGQASPVAVPPSTSTSGVLQTSPTDTSNASLNQDLGSIDAQLNGLASDSASVDQGLNDQPVPQGQ